MDILALGEPVLASVLTVFCYVTIGFIVSVLIKRNDIADIMWGPGIALSAHSAVWFSGVSPTPLITTLLLLITIWALRLGFRIARKNLRKPSEDPRYKRWRDNWQFFYLRSYFQVFLLQGFLMLVLAYPVIHAGQFLQKNDSYIITIGILIWTIGFLFEAIGDYQLDHFLKDPQNKGKLMKYGLWRYSRHPNYFGEMTMWWAVGLMTVNLPYGWLTLISPITITLLIRYVSGVPLLEAMMAKHPEWSEYASKTSMIIPLPPRK